MIYAPVQGFAGAAGGPVSRQVPQQIKTASEIHSHTKESR
jgi:hypothetical protein